MYLKHAKALKIVPVLGPHSIKGEIRVSVVGVRTPYFKITPTDPVAQSRLRTTELG